MLVTNMNPTGYKQHVIQFIVFAFGEDFTIIGWLENMKVHVYDFVESYKYTIISYLGNSDTSYLLLHIVQCWRACAVDAVNQALPMVL